jgi:hypothetical protein
MNCLELQRHLDAVLDREPAAGEDRSPRAVRRHLEACARCRRAHGPLLDWIDRLAADPPAPLPERLASLPSGQASPARRWTRTTAARATAAGLLLALGLGLVRFAATPVAERRTPAPEPKAAETILGALRPLTPIRLERRDRTVIHDSGRRVEATYRTFAPAVAVAVADPHDEEMNP